MKVFSSPSTGRAKVASGQVAILFTQFGPYHHARVRALQAELPGRVVPAQIAAATRTYAWKVNSRACEGVTTLCEGVVEDVSAWRVFRSAVRFFRKEQIRTVFLPSYAPKPVFALYAAAVWCRCRRIMMNESHALTERATGWKRGLKRLIVGGFHSAIVGGAAQKRHFESLGLAGRKIFTGYDAIDNAYFAAEAESARSNAEKVRATLGLPERYFLNLGRFVSKKDLPTLLHAFASFRSRSQEPVDLVLVGSGELEETLKQLAKSLGLAVRGPSLTGDAAYPETHPAVHFMGFRQVTENPSFYALAEGFVLPSVEEEWGLVVNEAMACGLPLVVSRVVGCAEDLVDHEGNGFLFDPGDVDALTDCLVRLAEDENGRQAMGKASGERIAQWDCSNFARNAVLAMEAAGSVND